jgi:hypothetical protein
VYILFEIEGKNKRINLETEAQIETSFDHLQKLSLRSSLPVLNISSLHRPLKIIATLNSALSLVRRQSNPLNLLYPKIFLGEHLRKYC